MSSRYLITAPWVMPYPGKLIANGTVFIEDNRIIQVARQNEIPTENDYDTIRIFQDNCLLMPGLINAH
ncbi:MAG: amidohydrolase, partial [Deltaproteobacteria bacterium]|nr:amidohydrolase [Deltaproteobacteria bacterium]